MKQESIFIKLSLVILIVSFLVIANEFVQLIPTRSTYLQGILLFIGPTIFAIIGGIFLITDLVKHKTKLGMLLTIINFILLFWPLIYFCVGTWIFGA